MPASTSLRLTPTARLARNEAHQRALSFRDSGASAWLAPKVLSFPAWLGELRADYLLNADDERVPVTSQQAQLLWQSLIDQSVFIGEPRVAELAQRAWRLIHEYELDPPGQWPTLLLSEDNQRFRDWAQRYRSLCGRRGLVDDWALNAELPAHIESRLIRVPDEIVLAGFDLPMTPLQCRILEAARTTGCRVLHSDTAGHPVSTLRVHAAAEPDDELRAAARWARAQIEAQPDRSIAVVVPDLAGRLARVESVFRQVFDPPGYALGDSVTDAWHISLGQSLAQWPMIAEALALLALSDQSLTQPEAFRLLRSPFLPGWDEEAPQRQRALARLIQRAPFELTHNELGWLLEECGAALLRTRLSQWQALRHAAAGPAWPGEWVGRFQQELSCFGFGTGRVLDSREHQVLQRWHDLLETLSTLDAVADAPAPRSRILTLLADSAAGAVFREQNRGAAIEVLGIEEALGSQFDALWITSLDAETWPGPSRRDPLIPAAMQAPLPRATPAGSLAHARAELDLLRRSAPRIEGSFSRGPDEAPARITGLLTDYRIEALVADPLPESAPMDEAQIDDTGPRLTLKEVQGGTGVLRNQSDCAFRAFAERRLGAADLTPPRPGLDAGQRGTVIHKALEQFWRDPTDHRGLLALTDAQRTTRVHEAVTAAIDEFTSRHRLLLSRAGRLLEQRRTERVLHRWLDVERQRSNFEVLSQEEEIRLEFTDFVLKGRIDRIDQLDDGGTLLLDYKTGRASRSDWFPQPRLADPQLPAYAVIRDPAPVGIAFAHIRPEALRFEGLSASDTGTHNIQLLADATHSFSALDDWDELLDSWRTHLDGLAADFASGVAVVDPRNASTCRHCHLHALCRIQERLPIGTSYEDDLEEGDTDD